MARRNNGVTFWDARQLLERTNHPQTELEIGGRKRWVPSRPMGWTDWPHRFKAMWMVWTGRADIVTWPGQE